MRKLYFFLYISVCIFVGLGGIFALGLLGWDFYFPGDFTSARPTSPYGVWIDLGLIAAFGVQHSLMARAAFKNRVRALLPEPLVKANYVMASGFMLLLIASLWVPLPGVIYDFSEPPVSWIFLGFAGLGGGLVVWASMVQNGGDLIGLDALRAVLRDQPIPKPVFATPGPYKVLRHPIYTGILLLVWGVPQSTPDHLLFAGGFTCYLFIGAWFEEKDLVQVFGKKYEDYRRKTGILLLFPWVGKNGG